VKFLGKMKFYIWVKYRDGEWQYCISVINSKLMYQFIKKLFGKRWDQIIFLKMIDIV
jgi:hypothetical protein